MCDDINDKDLRRPRSAFRGKTLFKDTVEMVRTKNEIQAYDKNQAGFNQA